MPGDRYPIQVDPDLWAIHLRYDRERAPADLSLLVEEYATYARSIARRLARRGEPLEDLTQVALEALVTALQRFDPQRGRPFAAYAGPTIAGVVKRHFRDLGWSIRTPRRVHDLAPPVRLARERLAASLMRPPTTAEVADELDLAVEVVRAVDRATEARAVSSLDRIVGAGDASLIDVAGGLDPDLERASDRVALAAALELLDQDDRELLALSFVDDLSQREIAGRIGYSQVYVSRRLARVLARLRTQMLD